MQRRSAFGSSPSRKRNSSLLIAAARASLPMPFFTRVSAVERTVSSSLTACSISVLNILRAPKGCIMPSLMPNETSRHLPVSRRARFRGASFEPASASLSAMHAKILSRSSHEAIILPTAMCVCFASSSSGAIS